MIPGNDRFLERHSADSPIKNWENMVQNCAVAIFVIDSEHLVRHWNRACEELTGIKAADILGTSDHWRAFYEQQRPTLSDLIINNEFKKVDEFYTFQGPSLLIPQGWHAEDWFPNVGGRKRYLIFDASPIYHEDGKLLGVIETLQDITVLKEMEEEKERLNRELREALKQIETLRRLEQKQIEKALSESEDRFQTLFNQAADSVCLIDPSQEIPLIVEANLAAHEMHGYAPGELIGQPLSLLNTQESQKHIAERMAILFSREHLTGEIDHIRKDGTSFPIEISAQLTYIKGKPYIQAIYRDITERKQMEEALRQSEERYRTIIETMEEGYFELDLAGKFTFVNDAECRNFGYSREELIGMTNRQYQDEITAKKMYRLFTEIYNTGKPVKAWDSELTKKDGTKAFNEISVSLIRNSKGEPIGFRGISRDVTELRQAQNALQNSEERFRIAAESSNDFIYEWDLESGQMDWFGDATEKLNHLLGKIPVTATDFDKIIHPDDYDRILEAIRRHLRHGVPYKEEYRMVGKEGRIIYVKVAGMGLRNREGRVYRWIGAISDITDRKQAEETLKTLSLKDDLTGLYNRRGFFVLAEQGLKTAQRMGTETLLIYGDVDNLKGINDTLGHQEGDQALIDMSQILNKTFRESDIIARMGGDEFVILAMNSYEDSVEKLVTRFEKALNDHQLPKDRPYALSMSLGIVSFNPQKPSSLDNLLVQADKMMYENKQKRKIKSR